MKQIKKKVLKKKVMKSKSKKYIRYFHQWGASGSEVFVRSDLKGKHREYCLCFACSFFKPDTTKNCQRAQRLYEYDVEWDMVTPVWECPDFVQIKK